MIRDCSGFFKQL